MAWTLCRSPSKIGRRLPMADKAPLLFSPRLGGLFPANAAAQKAMQDITGKVRVEIKQTLGNMRRMALYWAILSTAARSEEHTSELQSLMRISYAVFCLKKTIIVHA